MRDDIGFTPEPEPPEPPPPPEASPLLKALGFAASGGFAFLTDALTLEALVRFAGLVPAVARLIAIAAAMVVGWYAHRTLTFQIKTRPTVVEFLRYAAVAWVAAAVNYAIFIAILWLWPDTRPLGALVVASLVAMVASYLGMRFGVFTPRPPRAR